MKRFRVALLLLDEFSAKYSGVMNLIRELKIDPRFEVYLMYDKRAANNRIVIENPDYSIEYDGSLVTGQNPYFDVVIVTNPYRLPKPDYSKWTSRIIYDEYGCAGHEIGSGNLTSKRVYKNAWMIIVDTDTIRDQLIAKLKPETIIVVGKPAYDYTYYLDANKNEDTTVIWTPHCSVVDYDYYHNILGGRYSTFMTYNELFIHELPSRYPNIKFKIKLHPNLGARIREAQRRGDLPKSFNLKNWIKLVSSNPNVEVMDPSEIYSLAFMESSAMINDSISFISEYLPTKKPMLILRDEGRSNYSEATEDMISKVYYNASSASDIYKFLDEVVLSGKDIKFCYRNLELRKLIPSDTTNSSMIANEIYYYLREEVD